MTKLKNTKKGMAKKALSISLVAAMLATSNVPVWAAEGLFSDGAVVEAEVFSAEAPVEDIAPAVEDAADVPALQAEGSTYTAEFKDLPSEIQWATSATIKIKVTDEASVLTKNMFVRYLENDVQSDEFGGEISLATYYNEADGYAHFPIDFSAHKAKVGHTYQLQVYEKVNGNIGWYQTSPEFTVTKQEVTGSIDLTGKQTADNTVRYTGKPANEVPAYAMSDVTLPSGVDAADIKSVENYQITGTDAINSVDVSGTPVTATGSIVSDYYTGKITATYNIWRKVVKDASEAAKVELPKYTYQYTGSAIKVPAKDIVVTDKLTGEIVKDAASEFTVGTSVGDRSTEKVSVDMTKGTLANFIGESDSALNTTEIKPAQDVVIAKRDLADAANTKISIKTVTQDLLQNSTIGAENLKNNLVIEDVDSAQDITGALKSEVSIDFDGKDTLTVEPGKTYTATVKTKTNNVINSCKVNFTVVAHDLGTAAFVKEENYDDAETYTGEKITKGLTKANLLEKLGDLKDKNGTILSPNVDFDTDVQFGENTNVGTGTIIINGKGSYEGSQKIISFVIEKRTADTLVVPEKVLYDATNVDGEDYALETSVTVKYTDADKKEHVLTVPATDYKVERTIVDKNGNSAKNEVGNYVKTTVTLTNDKGNFTFGSLSKTTMIANKAITSTDVTMEKTSYTYTGAEIKPEYKVVVAGQTLEKGVDFEETVTHNVNVGKAVLTITGKGDFDKTSVTKEFEIVPAKTADVKVAVKKAKETEVVYNGKKHTPGAENLDITLNGNDVSTQFTLSYPVSKTANINAGEGQITLTPVKGNKNFEGVKDTTFTIGTATLTGGALNVYDEKGTLLTIANQSFDYDGSTHTFAKEVYKNTAVTSPMKLTATDYEIIYKDHAVGDANGKGHILVVAKGNYGNAGTYTCADGTVVNNVVVDKTFTIEKISIAKKNITVNNGTYKGGFDVEPEVKIVVDGKTLVKDVDYQLVYGSENRKDVTNGKTLPVTVKGKGGYKVDGSGFAFSWGIDKFDLANAEIMVSGTDAEPVVKLMNGSVLIDAAEYDMAVSDGKVTVTAKAESKGYTGTKTADIKHELEKPETPVIKEVKVVGNKATVVLEGECEGATGYDYVISTNGVSSDPNRLVNKNVLATTTGYQYLQQGMYWAHCHAWKRDENGKKVFSSYSTAYPFSVSAITPGQPVITSVKSSGSTVTVTYTRSKDATGYDIVLGTQVKKVNGENRPVNYGKLVKKVYSGNTVTATFKGLSKGTTYYAGLHAYNRTSEDGKKVFSPWSNYKKVVVR